MTVRLIEGQVPYTGGTAIEITADKVINLLLRSEDNLLQVNQDNELYCDLQLANGITPNDDFPVGVTTGIVNANDGRPQNGLLLHYETTSGAYAQWLYAQDGYFYLDGGTGVFKKVYYAQDVDDAIQALADSLATVAFTGDYNDLINKPTIGNAVLTIQKNGTTLDTFTANATVDKTINVTVPTALSDLTNDLVNDGKLTIKRNNTTIAEFTANDATNVYADISVPELTNNTTTPSSTTALTAAMGKELQDQINNINMIGRFLSLWNCATGLPQTNPTVSPYTYHTGDYYVIGNVDATTNYKPDGGSYTIGVASTTVETATVGVGDMYFYDGTNWTLKKFTGQTFPIDNVLSTTSTNAVENRVVTNALLGKADLVSSATNGDLAGLDSNGNLTDSGVAAANVVQTTGNQTINGTKTFTTSPVVPSKTTSATNNGTAIATEAQVYLKADATDLNTKTFYLSSTNDLTTAQAALDWYLAGKNPILVFQNSEYLLLQKTSGSMVFGRNTEFFDGSSGSYTTRYLVSFTLSSDTVTAITNTDDDTYVLRIHKNYSTPYTPEYDGSPATKKYVDDSINTKTFYVSGNTDLTTAQAILNYYQAGNNPILNTSDGANWIMTEDTGTTLVFSNDNLSSYNDPNGSVTEGQYTTWEITYSGTTATQITNATYINSGRLSPYLATNINYSTPYTPVYNGSPATKKYVDDKQTSISVTLLAANWSSKSITVTATGVTSSNTVIIAPDPSSITDYADSSVYCSAQGTNSLTFSCDTEPTNDLTVNVVILN